MNVIIPYQLGIRDYPGNYLTQNINISHEGKLLKFLVQTISSILEELGATLDNSGIININRNKKVNSDKVIQLLNLAHKGSEKSKLVYRNIPRKKQLDRFV